MSKQFVVRTARIGYSGQADEIVLDTTAKAKVGEGKLFAPTWEMVMASKHKKITWEEYTKRYTKLLRQRYRENRRGFEKIVEAGEVVLLCFCANSVSKDQHCHRYLLADVLVKVAESMGYEAKFAGEVVTK